MMEHKEYPAGLYAVDFEFRSEGGRAGNPPAPVCMVVKRLDTGTTTRLWQDDLEALDEAPFPTGPDALWVAYFSCAEWSCFLSLGWSLPVAVLDLYTEFRWLTNGSRHQSGNGLLDALAYYQLPAASAAHKDEMRDLVLRGGPWSAEEKGAILNYCESDVEALGNLYQTMVCHLDLPRALLRGRYMAAVARIEHCGAPVDAELLHRFKENWAQLTSRLIRIVDREYGVYEGESFRLQKFSEWLRRSDMRWPTHPSGQLQLDAETFRAMAAAHPILTPLHQLRKTLGQAREIKLEVGSDSRARCLLSPFRARTGRNQPSTTKFPYALPAWLRSLIRPKDGMALAYIDWEQQEFGIGAALSGDVQMKAAYTSGDPYLEFAKQAGAVPSTATKQTHPTERDQFKACVLATQYGLGVQSLAERIGVPAARAKQLLDLHRTTYPRFWAWSDDAVNEATLGGRLWTCFGWQIDTRNELNDRSLRNFPMQAHGAEMLRIACILLTEAGIRVCAPVHDAVLIEAPAGDIDGTVQVARKLMAEASRLVLPGFELRTDSEVVRYPARLAPAKGKAMFESVLALLDEIEAEAGVRQ